MLESALYKVARNGEVTVTTPPGRRGSSAVISVGLLDRVSTSKREGYSIGLGDTVWLVQK